MLVLILGLIIFLGAHSVRIFAEDWRRGLIARLGDGPWKGLYSLVSVVGLVLIIWGYGMARQDPVLLWTSPDLAEAPRDRAEPRRLHPLRRLPRAGRTHEGAARASDAAFGEGLGLRASPRQRHARRPLAVRLVPRLGDRRFRRGRRRDRAAGTVRIAGPARNDAIAVVVGVVIWAAILWRVHDWVIGVSPLA